MAFTTELESPMVDRLCGVPSETVSFNDFTHCQHRSRVGPRAGATSVDGCRHTSPREEDSGWVCVTPEVKAQRIQSPQNI